MENIVILNDGIKQINTDGGRWYQTPEGNRYPSSTSVVSILNNKAIEQWRQTVGNQKADQICKAASENGSAWHALMEHTILNGRKTLNFTDKHSAAYSKTLQIVYPHISDVFAVERTMYSDQCQVAGTSDLIAKWDHVDAIIDWKTASHFKSKDKIVSYWCQLASYAIMVKERYDLDIKKLVLVFNVNNGEQVYFYENNNIEIWKKNFIALREKFKKLKGF